MRGLDTVARPTPDQRGRIRSALDWRRFVRGDGPQAAPVHLHQRRVYVLPTRRGLAFASLLLLMLIGSMNYDNSLAYLMTFFLASIWVVSILHTYRNLIGLNISIGAVEPVFAGQSAPLRVLVNSFDRVPRYAVEVGLGSSPPARCDVQAGETAQARVGIPTRQRGRFALPVFTISTRYPLGLFRAWSPIHVRAQHLVYPTPALQAPLPGEHSDEQRGRGDRGQGADDFAGLRVYRSGDSWRHVHWKAVAREQDLLTKQFGGDQVEELWLDWNDVAELDHEQRLSVLARWVLDAEKAGAEYGLRLPNVSVALGRGNDHRARCLAQLALFEVAG